MNFIKNNFNMSAKFRLYIFEIKQVIKITIKDEGANVHAQIVKIQEFQLILVNSWMAYTYLLI